MSLTNRPRKKGKTDTLSLHPPFQEGIIMDFNVKTQGGGDFAVELMEAKKNGMGERISRKRIAKSPWQAAILTLVGCPIEAVRPSKKKRREQREKELYRWHRAEQARAQQAVQRQCEELIQRFQEKMK